MILTTLLVAQLRSAGGPPCTAESAPTRRRGPGFSESESGYISLSLRTPKKKINQCHDGRLRMMLRLGKKKLSELRSSRVASDGDRVWDREAPSVVHAGACTANAGARVHGSVGVRIRGCTGARPPASAPTPDSGGAVRLMQAPARWPSEVATAHAMHARTAPHVCADPPILPEV